MTLYFQQNGTNFKKVCYDGTENYFAMQSYETVKLYQVIPSYTLSQFLNFLLFLIFHNFVLDYPLFFHIPIKANYFIYFGMVNTEFKS